MADIYDNLENYKEILTHEQLVLENEDLKINLDETRAELKQIKMDILQDFDKLLGDHQQLLINYSSLLKTARAEVERKADMMMDVSSKKDLRFLRLLHDRTNLGKAKGRGKKAKKKSGSADICDQRIESQTLKDDKDQQLERKDVQQKPKTDYRIPKLSKPKDEPVVPKKETRSEIKKQQKCNDGLNEKENKEQTVKAGSIFNRRKSMPALRHEPVTFSSDDEESRSTITAKSSYSSRDDTDASTIHPKYDKSTESQRKKPSEPSFDMRHSRHWQPSKTEARHSEQHDRHLENSKPQGMESRHFEPPRDLRLKLTKTCDSRENRSKERFPSREDRQRERYEDREHRDRYRRSDAIADARLSRRDTHDHRQHERGRQRFQESPPPDKYSRNKSRERRFNQQSYRRIEHNPPRHRPYHDAQESQRSRDELDRRHSGQQIDKPPEPKCEWNKAHSVLSGMRDEEGEPMTKRRRVGSRSLEEEQSMRVFERPKELVAMSPHTCQSPDELLVDNVHVETPVKEVTNTVATGLEDPRLTSKRYIQIVEEKNRIRLSTVTGRNVDLAVLPPYSNDIFQSKDPNGKFEEYTEEDLVKDIYIDFDENSKDFNDTLESGEIDENYVYSDLIDDPLSEKQKTTNIVPPLLLSAPLDTPQMSQFELLQPAHVKTRQIESDEVLQESITKQELEFSQKPIEDEPSYSGVMAKKFRIPKRKSTENDQTSEDNKTTAMETVSANLTSTPNNPLEIILSHITQKYGGNQYHADTKTSYVTEASEAERTETHLVPCSSANEGVTEQNHEITCHSSEDKRPAEDPKSIKATLSLETSIVVHQSELKEKVLTKQQIVEGDLELSDDDVSANNLEQNLSTVKEIKETSKHKKKHVEDKKLKTRSRTRKETEDKKTAEKDQGKDKSNSSKFTDLFGDSSSLITPEDLDLYTRPCHELQPDIVPPLEDEAAVDIDMMDKVKATETSQRRQESAKISTKSTSNPKKEELSCKKPSRRAKGTERTEKPQTDKAAKLDDETAASSETVKQTAVDERVAQTVETEPNVVKTVIISTGTQPFLSGTQPLPAASVVPETSGAPTAVVLPMPQISFKPFSEVYHEPITALATSTPSRDLRNGACVMLAAASKNNGNETRVSDEDSSMQSVIVDSSTLSKEADAPDVRVILKRRRKRVIK